MTTIVVAMGEKNEIGFDNQLRWHLPKDFNHFNDISSGEEKHMKVLGNLFRTVPILLCQERKTGLKKESLL